MKRFLLVTTAFLTAVAPMSQALASALQDPPPANETPRDRGGRDRDRDRGDRRDRGAEGGFLNRWTEGQLDPANPPRPDRPARPDRPRDGGDRGGRDGGGRDGGGRDGRDGRGGDDRGGRDGRDDRGGWDRGGRDGRGGDDRGGRDGRDGRGDWDRGGRDGRGDWGRDRDGRGDWSRDRGGRDRDDFRRRWDRDNWRRDWDRRNRSDWWRNHRWFRDYSGFRLNFYFAPGYGYYSVPRNYWNRQWRQGEYLPSIFWRYVVHDYAWYGLPYPPAGTAWVYVNNDILLIDLYDGYIIDVAYRVWAW